MAKEQIAVFDTTLRDGEQSPGCSMNLQEKVRMARQLESLGVDIIEAGFPIASEGDFAAVRAVARECRNVTVAALCRTSEQDVLRANHRHECCTAGRAKHGERSNNARAWSLLGHAGV